MSVYRVVMFKLKKDTSPAAIQAFVDEAKQTMAKFPGVKSYAIGPPLDLARTKGFDFGIVMELEHLDLLAVWESDPNHRRLHNMREAICEESLAFSLPGSLS
ncbi:hypothetical protein V8E51_005223 [Hyaloscypha variabilis]